MAADRNAVSLFGAPLVESPPWLSRFRPTSKVLLLVSLYCLFGFLGKTIAGRSGQIPLVWPPFALALAAVLLFGQAYWPAVAAGAFFFALLIPGTPWTSILAQVLGNTVGTLIGVYLLKRSFSFQPTLQSVRDVAGFVIYACGIGTAVNAAFSGVIIALGRGDIGGDLLSLVLPWWMSNGVAVLVLTPFLLVWTTKPPVLWTERSWIESSLCSLGLIGATLISFRSWYVQGVGDYALAYLPVPFLVWGSIRFGQRGAVTGSLLISTVALIETLEGRGPFVLPGQRETLMLLGSYACVLGVLNMFLAGASMDKAIALHNLLVSERRYRGVVEDQTEMVWRFDEKGTLTFVNEAYCRFHEKPREELIGTKYLSMLSAEDREIPLSYFQDLPPESPVVTYDLHLTSPNGDVTTQQCATRRIVAADGRTIEFQSVARDITARKRMEDELRQAEQRQRFILNSMPDAVVVVDNQGRINLVNRAAENFLGYLGDQLNGRDMAAFLPDGASLNIGAEAETLHSRFLETSVVTAKGEKIPVEFALNRATLGGKQVWIAVFRDIRVRKGLEQQLRQAQKMELLGRMSTGIAHDFNNLLQSVSVYVTLLAARRDPDDPNSELIAELERTTNKALGLGKQLLAFSRKRELTIHPLSVNTVLKELSPIFNPLLGKNVRLEIQPLAKEDTVSADRTELQQVFLNLVLNARDAMGSGGVITLETSDLSLAQPTYLARGYLEAGSYLLIKVKDTGAGIPLHMIEKVFEPFFTTKGEGKGTGLGLAIVEGIVTASGGQITVESTVGQGTTFKLYFPKAKGA